MFDTFLGLPMHVLVVHAVVVVVPLATVSAVVYAVRPPWRGLLRWPTLTLAVVAGLSSFVAGESGEAFERRLERAGVAVRTVPAIRAHVDAGDVMKTLGLIFMVVAVVAVGWLLPAPSDPGGPEDRRHHGRPAVVASVAGVVLVLVALAALYQVVVTGHSGAAAVWATAP